MRTAVGCVSGGCTWSRRCTWSRGGTVPGNPPVNRMTDRCKNITLPQTSFAGGNNHIEILDPRVLLHELQIDLSSWILSGIFHTKTKISCVLRHMELQTTRTTKYFVTEGTSRFLCFWRNLNYSIDSKFPECGIYFLTSLDDIRYRSSTLLSPARKDKSIYNSSRKLLISVKCHYKFTIVNNVLNVWRNSL